MNGENQLLKFKASGKLPIILEESMEYLSNKNKENPKVSTCLCCISKTCNEALAKINLKFGTSLI
jgi:hypothetical protein